MSVKTLVIVESPAKCQKIGGFLGPNYIVKASFGHIRGILDGLKAIDFANHYKIKYDIIETKKKQVAELRKAAKECSDVIIASDADREGEAIGFHLAIVLGLNPHSVKRITFQEITKKAILAAASKPGKLDMNLVYSQEARAVLDLLVGFELSPLVSQFIGGKLSAGRCQSPAVRLVLEREQDILKQDTTSSFTIDVLLYPDGNSKLQLGAHFKKKYVEKEQIMNIYGNMKNNSYYQISDFQKKLVEHSPPKPYTTSTIQQDCSSILSMNPKECMSILQKLYEGGKITYMRTDSVILSKDALLMLSDEVKKRFGEEYHQYREYKNKGGNAQEAHEAIRPTHAEEYPLLNTEKEPWSAREARVYELVWKRTMASQMANQRIQRHTTTIDMYYSKPVIKYTDDQLECIIDQLEFDGWRKLYNREELSEGTIPDDESPAEASLDDIKQLVKEPRPKLYYSSAIVKQIYSRSLCRYTEASLIKDLESRGIGRPSTYANIMETIIRERGYVEVRDFPGIEKDVETIMLTSKGEIKTKLSKTTLGKEKKKLTISALGENVMKFLLAQFENIINYNFTKQVEDELDQICEQRSTYAQVVNRVYQTFHPKVVQLKLASPEVRKIVGGKEGDIELGIYEDDQGEDSVILKNGPYGHYLQFRGENYGLKFVDEMRKKKIVEEHDVEEAVEIIDEQREAKKRKEASKTDTVIVGKFEIKKGPYGYYFTHNKKNYGIGQREPSSLTEKDIRDIMENKKQWVSKKETDIKSNTISGQADEVVDKKSRGRLPKKI
jgi:DNA topoisomerase-1